MLQSTCSVPHSAIRLARLVDGDRNLRALLWTCHGPWPVDLCLLGDWHISLELRSVHDPSLALPLALIHDFIHADRTDDRKSVISMPSVMIMSAVPHRTARTP